MAGLRTCGLLLCLLLARARHFPDYSYELEEEEEEDEEPLDYKDPCKAGIQLSCVGAAGELVSRADEKQRENSPVLAAWQGEKAAWEAVGPAARVLKIPFKIGQPKKQIVPKTVERDFEREYGKLQQLEDQTKKLQKDMKKSTDADLAMSKSAVKISSDLLSNPLCEQEPSFLEMVTAFDTAMKRMDSFNQEKVNQIQKTVIEPLKKFSSVFPSLNMAVKRREQTLQDYKRLQSKVEKYEEKERTGPVLAKLHQAREELRPVKEDFEAKNKQLLEEMPKFYSSRIDYFKPSFESLVRAQGITRHPGATTKSGRALANPP
ncbi:bridging integrator 3 [Phaethornis superciliosus]